MSLFIFAISHKFIQLSHKLSSSAAVPASSSDIFPSSHYPTYVSIETDTIANALGVMENNRHIIPHNKQGSASSPSLPPNATNGHFQPSSMTISTILSFKPGLVEVSASSIGDLHMDHYHGSSPSDGEKVWYCSECGDGPIASWNPCCANCGHATCYACTFEES